MADFQLQDNQEVVCDVTLFDADGNVVTGDQLDAGSLSVTVSDTTKLTATPSTDQTQVTVSVVAGSGLATGITVTPTATLGGTALTGLPLSVDITASVATSVGLVPGTPSVVTPPVGG